MQISSLQSELDRVRAHAEEEKKELVGMSELSRLRILASMLMIREKQVLTKFFLLCSLRLDIDEMERTKEQIVTMEETFLLWRTKVHNDQMTLQDNLLNERLDKQDRVSSFFF